MATKAKKITAMLLAAAMVLSVCSCGDAAEQMKGHAAPRHDGSHNCGKAARKGQRIGTP